MKALLKKLSCFLLSLFMFASPIVNNVNYHNSLLEVYAEGETNLSYNEWLVLLITSLGISITSLAPSPFNWVGDEFKKFCRRYDENMQNRIEEAEIKWKAQMKEPIFTCPAVLYNSVNDFVTFLKNTYEVNTSKSVEIGDIITDKPYIYLTANSTYYSKNHRYAFYTNMPGYLRISYQSSSSPIYQFFSKVKGTVTFYYGKPILTSNSFILDPGSSYYGYNSYFFNSNSFLDHTSIQSMWGIPPASPTDDRNSIYNTDTQTFINHFIVGDGVLESPLNDKVIGMGDAKLDDRVMGTDSDVTLDWSKVDFGQTVGSTATIADISKWLNGAINSDVDLDWGKVIPIPDVKPIPIPEPTTEPLPTTEPVPTTDPAPTPFPPGEIENYQTPSLTNVFPFCIPYDVVSFFGVLNAEPQAPKWTFDLNNISEGYKITIDMKDYESIIVVFRYGMLGLFIIGLILITRYIVGGQ